MRDEYMIYDHGAVVTDPPPLMYHTMSLDDFLLVFLPVAIFSIVLFSLRPVVNNLRFKARLIVHQRDSQLGAEGFLSSFLKVPLLANEFFYMGISILLILFASFLQQTVISWGFVNRWVFVSTNSWICFGFIIFAVAFLLFLLKIVLYSIFYEKLSHRRGPYAEYLTIQQVIKHEKAQKESAGIVEM